MFTGVHLPWNPQVSDRNHNEINWSLIFPFFFPFLVPQLHKNHPLTQTQIQKHTAMPQRVQKLTKMVQTFWTQTHLIQIFTGSNVPDDFQTVKGASYKTYPRHPAAIMQIRELLIYVYPNGQPISEEVT